MNLSEWPVVTKFYLPSWNKQEPLILNPGNNIRLPSMEDGGADFVSRVWILHEKGSRKGSVDKNGGKMSCCRCSQPSQLLVDKQVVIGKMGGIVSSGAGSHDPAKTGASAMYTESAKEFKGYTPDELRELYKKDPAYFDALAAAAISQACIGGTDTQTMKLRQLQWFIDGQLRKAKTPLQRMQIMENIFYSRVFGDDGELAHLRNSCEKVLDAFTAPARSPARKSALYLLKRSGGADEIVGTA